MRFKKQKLFLGVVSLLVLTISTITLAHSHREWTGDANQPFKVINNNIPNFTEEEKQRTDYFMVLSPLDSIGRVGSCYINVSKEKLPKDDREPSLGSVEPTGWRTNGKSNNNKYPGVVSGNYIYNRCHLLGFQLSGLNAEKKNLFTGTRYINVIGQLPFENDVASYVKKTGNHVLYRVTPIFEGSNKICEGVVTEGWSVEDQGQGICFNVFCFNVQPGVEINYATGENKLANTVPSPQQNTVPAPTSAVIDTTNTTTRTNTVPAPTATQNNDDGISLSSTIASLIPNNLDEKRTWAIIIIIVFTLWFFSGGKNNNSNNGGGSNYSNYRNRR